MVIKNISKGTELASRAYEAKGLLEKIAGLIARPPLQEGEALILSSLAPWIHSFFMKYPIDLVFLSRKGNVVGAQTLSPWRLSSLYLRARWVLELPAGTIKRSRTEIGDTIEIV